MTPKPIGIFDSGVGGLTVARAIRKALPMANIWYFGDTEHMPYGEKSPATIRGYVRTISKYLSQRGAGSIVIACNTASALGYEEAVLACPHLPVINVIDPVVAYVSQHFAHADVAVIGTRGTIASGVYPTRLTAAAPGMRVHTLATPILASLIEENIAKPEVITGIVSHYLDRPGIRDAKVLILACTHYPLIRQEISRVVGPDVTIIDPGEWVAESIKSSLGEDAHGRGEMYCEVSDYTDAFADVAKRIFGENLQMNEYRLWEMTQTGE